MSKCPECPPEGAPGWMVTYGDLMTLLLCFFVLLFSFSSLDVIVMKSLKESYVGAYGFMDGHSAIDGAGVSQQPQKFSSKLFDRSMEKVRKAKSDKFPRDQLVFLNGLANEVDRAIGLIEQAESAEQASLDRMEQLRPVVQEKIPDDSEKESPAQNEKESIRDYLAKTVDPRAPESVSERREPRLMTAPSREESRKKMNDLDPQRNYADQPVDKVVLARGGDGQRKLGDASRNQKLIGRNLPLAGNPGENEMQEDSTGHKLRHNRLMDRVDGQGQRKRFDYPVPVREFIESDINNIAGEVKDSQSDANRTVQTTVMLDAADLFSFGQASLKPGASQDQVFTTLRELLLEHRGEGYFQIESYVDGTEVPEGISAREFSLWRSIEIIQAVMRFDSRITPSMLSAVGWGVAKAQAGKRGGKPNSRVEIRLVKSRP